MSWARFLAVAGCVAPAISMAGDHPGNCVTQPSCLAPVCAPPAQPATAAMDPAGMFAQPPATGDVQGESTGYGIRGMGIRFPEVNLQLPTLQLPSTFKYRRGPEMQVEAATAGYLTGPAANFGMMATAPAAPAVAPAVAPVGMPPAPYHCAPQYVPPCESSGASLERRLLEELIRKENELREMNQRFSQLESMVSRLAERKSADPQLSPAILPSSYEQPAPLPQVPAPRRVAPAPVKTRTTYQPPVSRPVAARRAAAAESNEFGDWSQAQPAGLSTAETLGIELADPFK